MKGIDKITSRILADAEAECAAVRKESDERIAAVKAEAEKKAQDEYWRLVREGVKDTEQRVQRMDRTARLEAKKSVLNMKQEAVSRAFELARDKIAELPERDYVGFLAREAAEAAITGQEEVVLCERDRAAVGAKAVKAANELLAAKGTARHADALRRHARDGRRPRPQAGRHRGQLHRGHPARPRQRRACRPRGGGAL